MHYQYEKPIGPKKPSAISKVREGIQKFREARREKPATAEEVKQLRLNYQRTTYKQKIKQQKGSSIFGSEQRQPSYRKGSRYAPKEESFLFGPSGGNGGFLNSDSSPSLDFITGANSKGRKSDNDGFTGKGLSDLF